MNVGDRVIDPDNIKSEVVAVSGVLADVIDCDTGLVSRYRIDQLKEDQQDTHYQKEVQPIDLIDAFNLDFNAGNVIKYVARAKHKGNELDDLRKAKYYLDRLYEKAKDNNTSK